MILRSSNCKDVQDMYLCLATDTQVPSNGRHSIWDAAEEVVVSLWLFCLKSSGRLTGAFISYAPGMFAGLSNSEDKSLVRNLILMEKQ